MAAAERKQRLENRPFLAALSYGDHSVCATRSALQLGATGSLAGRGEPRSCAPLLRLEWRPPRSYSGSSWNYSSLPRVCKSDEEGRHLDMWEGNDPDRAAGRLDSRGWRGVPWCSVGDSSLAGIGLRLDLFGVWLVSSRYLCLIVLSNSCATYRSVGEPAISERANLSVRLDALGFH